MTLYGLSFTHDPLHNGRVRLDEKEKCRVGKGRATFCDHRKNRKRAPAHHTLEVRKDKHEEINAQHVPM